MKILISNDDGIRAEGIREIVLALGSAGHEIYVSSPHTERSATGHGITIGRPIKITETTFEGAKAAIMVEGLPADCVKIGLSLFEKRGVYCDMVVSGINHGGNIGTDTLYSGTVSAAIEGALCNRNAVAVSILSHAPKQFKTACSLAIQAAGMDFSKFASKTVININVPDLEAENIKGLKFVPLGIREYDEWFEQTKLEDGSLAYVYGGLPVHRPEYTCDTNDVGAIQDGYATITPLQFDLTNHKAIDTLTEAWGK
jgi:5'-nucleotidase